MVVPFALMAGEVKTCVSDPTVQVFDREPMLMLVYSFITSQWSQRIVLVLSSTDVVELQ
jgi:hypothetical protein